MVFYYSEIDNSPYYNLTIKDYPGIYHLKETFQKDIDSIKTCGSLVYVIDAQQKDYEAESTRLANIIKLCCNINKSIYYEVFIHKIETDSEDQRIDILQKIQELMRNLLNDIYL